MTPEQRIATWRDRDRSELDRARALLACVGHLNVDVDANVAESLVDVLNEPLMVLPRLAFERLRDSGVRVSASVSQQRLRRCDHGPLAHMPDDDTAATGRSWCVDCNAVVVHVANVAAIAAELDGGCALFRSSPLPSPMPWMRIDERRVDASHVMIGGGADDDVVNAGLPAGALSVTRRDDGLDVSCADGIKVRARAPLWTWNDVIVAGDDEYRLARSRLATPTRADLVVFREHDTARRSVVIAVDVADALALEVVWLEYSAQTRLGVGEQVRLSFDGAVSAVRTATGVILRIASTPPRLVEAPPGEVVPLPIGDATAVWRGRRLELRHCPPPPARSRRVNLLTSVAARNQT